MEKDWVKQRPRLSSVKIKIERAVRAKNPVITDLLLYEAFDLLDVWVLFQVLLVGYR